jgi:Zn-dependent protease
MILLEPGQTAFDLRWRMFGVDVRVHPMFWLIAGIMGFSLLQRPGGELRFLMWMGCFFLSILIHEFGHVFMFRACGVTSNVVLYAFGGLAIPHRPLYDRWQRIAVSLAGPLAEFLLLGVIVIAVAVADVDKVDIIYNYAMSIFGLGHDNGGILGFPPLIEDAIFFLILMNLFWGLLNLLPIWPLDGGQVSKDFLDGVMPGGQGLRLAFGISLVLAGLLAAHCIAADRGFHLIPFLPSLGGTYSAVMFGLLAVQSFQMLQQVRNPPWRRDDW